jgi:cytochrome c-type biogenesis protein CcmH/NrfG
MSFWRREVIDPALDHETSTQIAEQRAWIAREPANPRPYYNLAQLYRVAFRPDEALGLLLEAIRLDPKFADAHASLSELYVVRADYPAAWRHASLAEQHGNPTAAELLSRYGVPRPTAPGSTPPPEPESGT